MRSLEVFGVLEPRPGPGPEGAGAVQVGFHVVLDQPGGPLGDRPFERLHRRADVVRRIDRLADVVQERRQQELLVVRAFVAGQLEHLERVIERVPLGVVLRPLLDPFQRPEQHAEELEPVDVVLEPLDLHVQIQVGIFRLEQRLELGDRDPLDGLAGDRALEDVMGLVLGVEGQLVGVAVVERGCGVKTRSSPCLTIRLCSMSCSKPSSSSASVTRAVVSLKM